MEMGVPKPALLTMVGCWGCGELNSRLEGGWGVPGMEGTGLPPADTAEGWAELWMVCTGEAGELESSDRGLRFGCRGE